MSIGIDSLVVFAAEGAGAAAPAGGQQTDPMMGILSFAPFILILIGFFWFTSRSQKKRDQERQKMLDAIRPKDDVVTIGGMYGRVVSVSDDDIVLRVDEENDVKITFIRSAISRKIGDETPQNT